MEYITHSPEETEKSGRRWESGCPLGRSLSTGGIWVRGKPPSPGDWPGGLGYGDAITSPTYTIVNKYLGGRLPLFHFDMYRLRSAEDLWDIGRADYLDRGVSAPWSGAKTFRRPWRGP